MRKFLFFAGCLTAGLALLSLASPAYAQSCSLCYTQAASSSSRMIQALKSGILILVVPPTLGSIGVIGILYQKRNHYHETDDSTRS